jgi:hypothetical protein
MDSENKVSTPPTPVPPAPAPIIAKSYPYGIIGAVLALGLVVIVAVITIPHFQKMNALKVEKMAQDIAEQKKEAIKVEEKAAADIIVKEGDAACAKVAIKYFEQASTDPTGMGPLSGYEMLLSHQNSRIGVCLLKARMILPDGITIIKIHDVNSGAMLGLYDENRTTEDGNKIIDPRKESAEKLMSE